jgi:death-on-curing protein
VRYLTVSDVIRINASEVGDHMLGDFGLLESAVLRPQHTAGGHDAYPDIHRKAAALMHSLIRNHPFIDGNKRTGVLAVVVFYGLNGWAFEMEDGDVVGLAVDVAEGYIDVDTLAGHLKSSVFPFPEPE